jgi:mono/diheme cytochrome c family protein
MGAVFSRRCLRLVLAGLALVAAQAWAQAPQAQAREIQAILTQRCTMCHSGDSAAAGLRLDSIDALLRGSAKGPVVKPRDAAGSELMRRLKGSSMPRMPMTGPPFLPDEQIAMFERWVAAGAPRGDMAGGPAGSSGATGTTGAAGPTGAAASGSPSPAGAPLRPAAGEPVTYAHVAPVFARRCAKCHTDNGVMGPAPEGYRLNSQAATLSANDRVRVVPGHPGASELVRRIRGQARPRMPFDGPPYLSDEEVRLIEDWVAQGARDAQGAKADLPVGAALRLNGTLGSGSRLDGLELLVTGRTRVDKRPAPGDYVEVRGRLGEQGQVIVERLRPR